MNDIAPELLEKVKETFEQEIAGIREDIKNGVKSYQEAYECAAKAGESLARSFGVNITAEILPDGMMYYNIADRVVRPMLKEEHQLASQAAVQAQTVANKAAGIGIKAQAAPFDEDRAQGIIDRVSSEPFDSVKWLLGEPVKTFAKNTVDQTIQKNVEFQGKSGLHPKIVRRASAGACEWCQAVAGTYEYPNVPGDVYRRHANCDCTVEYVEGGKYQDVWTKRINNESQADRRERIISVTENEKRKSRENPNRVDVKYLNSAEFRNKFAGLTDSPEADQRLYKKAIDILLHRNGTEYEDLHLLLSTNGRVVGSQTHSTVKLEVTINGSIKNAVDKYSEAGDLIGIHNHPNSLPPSGGDFGSAIERNYKAGVITCHNGDVYVYTTGNGKMRGEMYDLTVEKYKKMGYSEVEAYNEALRQLHKEYGITWRKI